MTPGRLIGWIIFIGGGAVAAAVGYAWMGLQHELDEHQIALHSLQLKQERRSQRTDEPSDERLKAELTVARRALARLNIPWDELLQALERIADPTVTLLGLEPDPELMKVRLTVEAKDTTSMLEYLRRMGADRIFVGAHIVSHQTQTQDPMKPVRFLVSAGWRGLPSDSVADTNQRRP